VLLNDTQRLKRYLAEEMVEEYEEGRISLLLVRGKG